MKKEKVDEVPFKDAFLNALEQLMSDCENEAIEQRGKSIFEQLKREDELGEADFGKFMDDYIYD